MSAGKQERFIRAYSVERAMSWNLLPSCIGSLPHTDPRRAVDLVLDKLKFIPFWPQLPRIGFRENMYIQFSHFLPGVKVDEEKKRITIDLNSYDPEEFYTKVLSDEVEAFAYPKEGFSGFHEFMNRDISKSVKAVKGQVTGPISLGFQITDQAGKPAIYDEAYSEIIRKNLNMMARWQEEQLLSKGKETIMFVDEPYLSIVGTPFASVSGEEVVKWINEVIEGIKGRKGIHCCANTDWSMVLRTKIDLLSFDAFDYGHTLALYSEEVERFLKRGGMISWGMIPNSEEKLKDLNPSSLQDRTEKLFQSLVNKGVSEDILLKQSILTPQCGLGGLNEELSEQALGRLVDLSKSLRKKHSLEKPQ